MVSPGGFSQINEFDIVLRVVVSAFIGAIVGFHRERKNETAGIQTHMLVSAGACLFVGVGLLAYEELDEKSEAVVGTEYLPQNPDRVLAGVASGVGFLGGGAIIKDGNMVKGLVTAAGLWTAAGIGSACAYGRWRLSLITAFLVIFIQILDHVIHIFRINLIFEQAEDNIRNSLYQGEEKKEEGPKESKSEVPSLKQEQAEEKEEVSSVKQEQAEEKEEKAEIKEVVS